MPASGRVEKKQERVLLACDNCRRRKIRCDSVRPQCGNCEKLKDECAYTPSARQATANTRYAEVENRIDKLEHVIEQLTSKVDILMSAHARRPLGDGDHINLTQTLVASIDTITGRRAVNVNGLTPGLSSDSGSSGSSGEGNRQTSVPVTVSSGNTSPSGSLHTSPGEPPKLLSAQNRHELTTVTVPIFNDRLAHLKNHTGGNEEFCTVYTSGVFLSLFSQADVERLSVRLNDPFLNQRLEEVSNHVWRTNQEIVSRVIKQPDATEFDSEFLGVCLNIYRTIERESHIMSIFLQADELEPELFDKFPENLQQGIHAAVILIGIADINMNGGDRAVTSAKLEEQRQIALNKAIRTLNIIRFSKPSCLGCRLSFLLVFVMAAFSTVPSLLHFVPLAIDMAKALGIDRPELNAKWPPVLAQRRNDLWAILEAFQYTLAISQSSSSWVRRRHCTSEREKEVGVVDSRLSATVDENGLSDLPQWLDGRTNCPRLKDRNLWAILRGSELEIMYDRARSTLFALHNREISIEALFREVCDYHQGLQEWSERAKPVFVEFTNEQMTYSSFLKWLDLFSKGTLCQKFFHLQILVYSIHAFYPSYLPPLPGNVNALEIVSNAARNLLACAVCAQRRKGACTLVLNSSVTAAIGTLLYKQLSFPDHPSNADDLEMLKRHTPEFVDTIWPSNGLGNPMTEIWKFLVDLMDRLETTRNSVPPPPPSTQPPKFEPTTATLLEEFDRYLPEELLTQQDGNRNVS